MRHVQRLVICAIISGVVSSAADLSLEGLIPKEKWETTGIFKLNEQEQKRLASEIIKLFPAKSTNSGVALISPSVSTAMMARQILAELHTSEVAFRRADQVLVVVRSGLYNPLMSAYRSVCDLQKEADGQLNIAGPNFHVYIYTMDDDLRVTETAHRSFPAQLWNVRPRKSQCSLPLPLSPPSFAAIIK